MREWLEHFGDETDANGNAAISSSQLSLLSSIVQAGEFVGALSAGFIGNRYGRRGGLLAASFFVTIGCVTTLHCMMLRQTFDGNSRLRLFKWSPYLTAPTSLAAV